MEKPTVSLHEGMKELLLSDLSDISYVSFFIEKEGMTKIPFQEFDRLTSGVTIDVSWLKDIYKLISLFCDNFSFVSNNEIIKYIYYVPEAKSQTYEMIIIDRITENPRWNTYDDEKKKELIFKTLHLDG